MTEVTNLEIKVGLQVTKPINVVYDAIVNPDIMRNYFISASTGRMEEGKTLMWSFPEFEGSFPVRVGKIEKNKYISYYWNDMDGTETFVEMHLQEIEPSLTFVRITEKGRKNDEHGINWLRRNTEGWANFLACLKAWLEYGINLRKKAFNISQIPEKNQ
jgi:uncharacterized protein YndB with AHSA1/START domain